MVTALKTQAEHETNTAVAETTATPAVVVAPAPALDISHVPETPAELLKQWDAPAPRPSLLQTVASALAGVWDGIIGPGMTQQQRVNREIAEHRGFSDTLHRNA